MSTNITTNGNGNGGVYYTPGDAASRAGQTSPSHRPQRSGEELVRSMQSVKELKQAEMKGEQVDRGTEQLIKAIERANKSLNSFTSLEFSVHEKTNQIMVKVLDRESGDVIREIPPEKTMDLVAKIWELAGILVDEKR